MKQLILVLLVLFLFEGAAAQSAVANISDSGFRPEVDGFSFENYGDEVKTADMTLVEMQRMFGERVCATTAGGKCVLSPPAEAWMEAANEAMRYGHCEGMAVLSALMYFNQISPRKFGALEADKLSLENELLQREIAYWWVTQVTVPGRNRKVNESPNTVLETLIEAFKVGREAKEWWSMGIYEPDGCGGHSITPIGVQNFTNGTARILVYDNNFPGATRAIEVDRNVNAWKYHTSVNPEEPSELYEGNASTRSLEVVSIPPRLDYQRCDFCDDGSALALAGTKGALDGEPRVQFWTEGNAHLLVTDDSGLRTGYLETGDFVNEIAGAEAIDLRFQNDPPAIDHDPVIIMPLAARILANLTGYGEAGDPDLTEIGPNYYVNAQNLVLNPDEQVSLVMDVSENDYYARLLPTNIESERSATLQMGVNTPEESFWFTIIDPEMEEGGTLGVHLDLNKGTFTFETSRNSEPGQLKFMIRRLDHETGIEQIFANYEYTLKENDQVVIYLYSYDGDSYEADVLNGGSTAHMTLHDNPSLHMAMQEEIEAGTEEVLVAGQQSAPLLPPPAVPQGFNLTVYIN